MTNVSSHHYCMPGAASLPDPTLLCSPSPYMAAAWPPSSPHKCQVHSFAQSRAVLGLVLWPTHFSNHLRKASVNSSMLPLPHIPHTLFLHNTQYWSVSVPVTNSDFSHYPCFIQALTQLVLDTSLSNTGRMASHLENLTLSVFAK